MTRYRRIAQVTHAKGLSGEVVAIPATNLPFYVEKDMPLWVVPPDHDLVRETSVTACVDRGDDWLLKLEGVDDRTTAQRLAGRSLLAPIKEGWEDVPATPTSLIGLPVVDARGVFGEIGTIREVRQGNAQDLWVVDGGPYGEVLIPAVDEFIRGCDAEAAYVALPDGLLELNK